MNSKCCFKIKDMYEGMLNSLLHHKINCQVSVSVNVKFLDLSFLEAQKLNGENNANVDQNSPEWLEIIKHIVNESRCQIIWVFVVNQSLRSHGTCLKNIRNIFRGYYSEDDAIIQFQIISLCKKIKNKCAMLKCLFFK